MPFPITYLLDQFAPSETFIRRELEQLRRRKWNVFERYLKGDTDTLNFSLASCPKNYRWRFFKAASARILKELPAAPRSACRIIRRLPQAAHLVKQTLDSDSRLIHAQFAGMTADLASIAAQTLERPWTCSVHAHDVFTESPRALYRRLGTAACVVACSQQAADTVLTAGLPRENVYVSHHGLPLHDYPLEKSQPDGALFCACRLEEKKGLDTLLQACHLLVNRGLHFTCAIAGEGPCKDNLRALCSKLGLEHTVFLIGWQSQEETRSRIRHASVLVLPSRRMKNGDRDGIANILIEAMALGTTVVTTTASAASEVITDNVNGLLVPPDDPAALAHALNQALASRELRLRLAKAARLTVEESFDGSTNICQLEAFFKQAAGLPA